MLSRAMARRLGRASLLLRSHRRWSALQRRAGCPAPSLRAGSVSRNRILVLALIVVGIAAFFALGGRKYFSFENVRTLQETVQSFYQQHPWQTAAGFFLVYVA